MYKLSIIIPAYNSEPYIHELIGRLENQITREVQVIVIDDCSDTPLNINKKWVELYRNKTNKGASYSRNRGLDKAKGEYIQFIDSDDLVSENYVEYVLNKIKTEPFDYMLLSWKSLPGGNRFDYKLIDINSELPPMNVSAVTRTFKRSFIGDLRFNENKAVAEDEEFTRHLDFEHGKKAVATEYMYFYRTSTPNSLSKRFSQGKVNTERIVYYFNRVTPDMNYLIDEIKEADKTAEVMVLTNACQLPELKKYCRIYPPQPMKATDKRGDPTRLITLIPKPIVTQVILYTSVTYKIGGLETFIYNFCHHMKDYYDIIVLYDTMDDEQIRRIEQLVRVEQNNGRNFVCDTLICNRVFDKLPENVIYKKSVQLVHCCKDACNFELPKDRDVIIPVSNAVKTSWGSELAKSDVIYNLTCVPEAKKTLFLISATRLDTPEKGQKRMIKLGKLLKAKNIPFIWLYFSNRDLTGATPEMIRMQPSLNVNDFIARADYLVQLSDSEAFCFSIVEALSMGVPVITTDLPVLKELNFVDGQHGYVVPFDMNFDVKKLLNKPKFEYDFDNSGSIKKWRKLLGNTKPKGDYNPDDLFTWIVVTTDYYDKGLDRKCYIGEELKMSKERAKIVYDAGFCEYLKKNKGN